jgi:hypothetical protein
LQHSGGFKPGPSEEFVRFRAAEVKRWKEAIDKDDIEPAR